MEQIAGMMLEMEEESMKNRGGSASSMYSIETKLSDDKHDKKPRSFKARKGGRVYRPWMVLQQYRNGNMFRDPNCIGMAGLFLFNMILLYYNTNRQHAVVPATSMVMDPSKPIDLTKIESLPENFESREAYLHQEKLEDEFNPEDNPVEFTDDDEYEVEEKSGALILKDALFSEPDVGDCDQFLGTNWEEEPFYICAPWGRHSGDKNNVEMEESSGDNFEDKDPIDSIRSRSGDDDTKDDKIVEGEGENNKDEKKRAGGEIKCRFHKTLKSSFCEANNLMVDPSKIDVSPGGEPLHAVKGRDEAEEMPTYHSGAFQMSQCTLEDVEKFGETKQLPYHLFDMMKSVREQEDDEQSWYGGIFGANNAVCSSYEERPTLIVTRYEYANLYHTYTDWYSAYQAAMFALDGNKAEIDNVNIVIFDGHAAGALDFGWKLLFKNATVSFLSEYQQNFRDDGTPIPLCFRHAIFVPAGYRASTSVMAIDDYSVKPPPSSYIDKCGESKWQRRFRETLVDNSKMHLARSKGFLFDHYDQNSAHSSKHPCHSRHFPHQHHLHHAGASGSTSMVRHRHLNEKKKITHLRVLLLSRQNYYSHPRMDGEVSRMIENEEELMTFLENYEQKDPLGIMSFDFPKIDVRRVVLEEHDISEQILMFQQANIVVGMHGAGLSHIILARPGTMLMEIQPPRFESARHFQYLASMAGCLYQKHKLDVARPVNHNDPYPVPIQHFELAFMDGVARFLDHHGAL